MLNFETHVSGICRKAARPLRIGNHLSLETKILIHRSFIKSNFIIALWFRNLFQTKY